MTTHEKSVKIARSFVDNMTADDKSNFLKWAASNPLDIMGSRWFHSIALACNGTGGDAVIVWDAISDMLASGE